MTCLYEFQTNARCPADGAVITFDVQVISERMITVEDLLSLTNRLTGKPIMQEPFTARLADELSAKVTTIGTHSGVKITCSA